MLLENAVAQTQAIQIGAPRASRDALDRQLTMTFQDGSTRTNVYDLAGDVTTNTDASFVFDSLNRLVEEVQTFGGNTQYVTHDQFNSTSATDLTYPNGRQVTSGYDALYRRNSISETSGGASIAAWQFTGDRIVECVLGNGLICTQLNNARTNSMVQSPSVPNPAWGDVSSDRLGYDGSGRMIAKRYLAGGINGTTFAYNNTTSLVGFTTYYDPNANKLFERALHAEERSALYPSYDSLNRLLEYQRGVLASGGGSISTAITLPGTDSQRTYDLDHLGNWKNTAYTPVGGSATTEVRRHNLVNQLTKFASTPVLYDHGNNAASSNRVVAARGNGNIANDGTRVYAYDALNRLTTVTRTSDSAQVAAYTYDAAGRRALKIVTNGGIAGTIANATYRYLYDDQQIVEELTGSNTTLRQFIWGRYIDELIQLKTYATTGTQPLPAGTYYPLQDLLYRTTALTDSSGNIVEAYDYDAYGNTLIYSGPGTDDTWFTDDDVTSLQPACEYLYTGRQYDPETEIYWYRARYYHLMLGRFGARDPIKSFITTNAYQAFQSSPMRYVDPSGRAAQPCTQARMDELREEYLRSMHEQYGGEPLPYYANWDIDSVISLAFRAYFDECDRWKVSQKLCPAGIQICVKWQPAWQALGYNSYGDCYSSEYVKYSPLAAAPNPISMPITAAYTVWNVLAGLSKSATLAAAGKTGGVIEFGIAVYHIALAGSIAVLCGGSTCTQWVWA